VAAGRHLAPDHLLAFIEEAHHEGWLGEVEGLKVTLAGVQQKLAQVDERIRRPSTVNLGIPVLPSTAPDPSRTSTS
jgi:hypothetical protein